MLSRLLLASGLGGAAQATAAAAATCGCHLQRCWASSSSSASIADVASKPQQLTPEQQQHLDTFRYLVAQPLEAAQNAALLTALTASYRDLYVVMDQFHKKDILGIPRPLTDEPPQPSSSSSSGQEEQQAQLPRQTQDQQQQLQQLNHTQMFYPLRDFTKLPDQPPPPGGFYRHHLQEQYMRGRYARAQLLPNHLEVSYHNDSFIYLWPPMETFYPIMLDPGYLIRHLKSHLKRTRVSRSQRKRKVRCSLGWRRNKPYHKQRVFGTPSVPAALRLV